MKKIKLLLLFLLLAQFQNLDAQEYDDIDFEEWVDDVPPASINTGLLMLGAIGCLYALKKTHSKLK